MTIYDDCVTLWDDGNKKLCAVAVPFDAQYKYPADKPCITVGFVYEDALFKGYDYFTFFDKFYVALVESIENTYRSLSGNIRLYDHGADTDGYIEISSLKNGKLSINGQLGASFSRFLLKFELEADQTLLNTLLNCIKVAL